MNYVKGGTGKGHEEWGVGRCVSSILYGVREAIPVPKIWCFLWLDLVHVSLLTKIIMHLTEDIYYCPVWLCPSNGFYRQLDVFFLSRITLLARNHRNRQIKQIHVSYIFGTETKTKLPDCEEMSRIGTVRGTVWGNVWFSPRSHSSRRGRGLVLSVQFLSLSHRHCRLSHKQSVPNFSGSILMCGENREICSLSMWCTYIYDKSPNVALAIRISTESSQCFSVPNDR